jgi:ribosome-associated toxin RatA of RatAB toxin-antitoxin module
VGATVWIGAAPRAVWRVMVDCPGAPEFVPGMRACRVLEEHGDVSLIEHRVKVVPALPELTYVFRIDHRPYRRIRFRRVAGALRRMEGEWRLRSYREGTLVSYTVVLDPGFVVPQWAVRRALTRDLPRHLGALKERVEAQTNHEAPSTEAAQ